MKGKVDVLLGLQWGDEGKGKEIDEMLSQYDAVARFQGGPNAGHSYKYKGTTIVGHLMPSGSLHEHIDLIVGNGVVLSPYLFMKEFFDLLSKGIDVSKRLYISERTKLLTYLHPYLDAAEEVRLGKQAIGSTLTGISPGYQDFKGRKISMVGDILRRDFYESSAKFLHYQMCLLEMYHSEFGYEIPYKEIAQKKIEWFGAIEEMKQFNICDVSELLRKKLAAGEKVLAEGAQGVMLDNDFGDYPFCTSSNTLTANACLGLGFPHTAIGKVYGVIKAYTTKVGGGSFPSRMKNPDTENLFREAGHEYGATTGRPRMCGLLDLVALKYAVYLSGIDGLFINKVDICPVDTIQVVTRYLDTNNKPIANFPLHLEDVNDVETLDFDGWGNRAEGVDDVRYLPDELIYYINYLESELGVNVISLGTGPERGQSVHL